MAWENETAAVAFGLKVLVPCRSKRQARQWLVDMAEDRRDMEADPQRSLVRCKSGGFAHFAWRDEQVIGMEYHEAMGPVADVAGVSDLMRSRVRLSETQGDTDER